MVGGNEFEKIKKGKGGKFEGEKRKKSTGPKRGGKRVVNTGDEPVPFDIPPTPDSGAKTMDAAEIPAENPAISVESAVEVPEQAFFDKAEFDRQQLMYEEALAGVEKMKVEAEERRKLREDEIASPSPVTDEERKMFPPNSSNEEIIERRIRNLTRHNLEQIERDKKNIADKARLAKRCKPLIEYFTTKSQQQSAVESSPNPTPAVEGESDAKGPEKEPSKILDYLDIFESKFRSDIVADLEKTLDNFRRFLKTRVGIRWEKLTPDDQEIVKNNLKEAVDIVSGKGKKVVAEPTAGPTIETQAPVMSPEEKQKRAELSRGGVDITRDMMSEAEFSQLFFEEVEGKIRGKSDKATDEILAQKIRELWKLFTVHGVNIKKKEDGSFTVDRFSDLDGKMGLWFMAEAGINRENILRVLKGDTQGKITDVEFVVPGAAPEGKRIAMDTSGHEGIKIIRDEEGKTRYYVIDHHADDSKRGSSAALYAHQMLTDLRLLPEKAYMNRMAQFIANVDNGIFPQAFLDKFFQESWKTIAGLERFVKPEKLAKFFESDKNPDPFRVLSDGELRKYGFIRGESEDLGNKKKNKSLDQEQRVIASKKALQEMEREGFIVESARYGKIAVDIGGRVGAKYLAARAFGCDGYVSWNPETNGFMISSKNPITDEFAVGKNVREIMLIKPPHDSSPLTLTLQEILEKMTDGKLEPTGKLKEYLENEKEALRPSFDAEGEKAKMKTGEWQSDEEELLEQLGGKPATSDAATVAEPAPEPIIEQQAEKELSHEDLEFLKSEAIKLMEDYSRLYLKYREHRKEPILFNEVANDVEQLIEDIIGHKSEKAREQADKIVKEILEK